MDRFVGVLPDAARPPASGEGTTCSHVDFQREWFVALCWRRGRRGLLHTPRCTLSRNTTADTQNGGTFCR